MELQEELEALESQLRGALDMKEQIRADAWDQANLEDHRCGNSEEPAQTLV